MITILVVDDEPAVRSLLLLYLQGLHYHVLEAENANDAWRISELFSGDLRLAIIDFGLRGGIDTARRILAARPTVRVLLISGYTEEAVMTGCGPVPVEFAFLQKPFSPRELLAKVEELVGASKAENAGR